MKTELKLLKVSRENVVLLTKDLTLAQINHIPNGFSNNIAWQIGHLIVTQGILLYTLAGLDNRLEEDFIAKYKKGSKPNLPIDQKEYDLIKWLFLNQLNELEEDINKGVFKEYTPYKTSYNFEITNIKEAVQFNNIHHALHITSINLLQKGV